MPFPANWPPRGPSGIRSIRSFVEGTASADYADNAFMFISNPATANTFLPLPDIDPGSLTTAAIGTNTTAGMPMGAGGTVAVAGAGGTAVAPNVIYCGNIRIRNKDGTNTLEFSFDGINTHGKVFPNQDIIYRNRYEGGIAVKGSAGTPQFYIEAW